MLSHKFPNPWLFLCISSLMCLSVFALFIMLFTLYGSLPLTRISLSPFLKIVSPSSKSHSMLSSTAYFLASLNIDLKWLCSLFGLACKILVHLLASQELLLLFPPAVALQ